MLHKSKKSLHHYQINCESVILASRLTSGQLVGVNFDMAFEAAIKDFAWHETYVENREQVLGRN